MTHLSTLVEIAADLRQRARQRKPPFSTRKIIAACFPTTVVTGRDLAPGVDELVTKTYDGALIVYRRELSGADQRVAIAHGLGHLVFDFDDARSACRVGSVGDPACERRADRFAEELLVPLSVLRKIAKRWHSHVEGDRDLYLDYLDEHASIFNVSRSVMHRQFRKLELSSRMLG